MTKTMSRDEREAVRERVGAAFKALRSLGFIARQNLLCCGGCAGAQIASDFAAMTPRRQDKVRGAVTFNRQNTDALERGYALMISFGRIESERGETVMSTEEVGDAVLVALQSAGLVVEWNGDASKRMAVTGIAKAEIPMAVGL